MNTKGKTAMKKLTTPLSDAAVRGLAAGDAVAISGVIYTGRDAAHKKLLAMLEAGEALPIGRPGGAGHGPTK